MKALKPFSALSLAVPNVDFVENSLSRSENNQAFVPPIIACLSYTATFLLYFEVTPLALDHPSFVFAFTHAFRLCIFLD